MVASRVLKPVVWEFGAPLPFERIMLPEVFRLWHRGKSLGMPVEACSVDGVSLSANEIERLNLWVGGDGAWRCSNLSYWDAWGAFDHVVRRDTGVFVGPAGAGRWASPVHLQKILQDLR